MEKLEEYRTVPGLRHVLLIDPDRPRVRLHTRGADGVWASTAYVGLEAAVPVVGLGFSEELAAVYERLVFWLADNALA